MLKKVRLTVYFNEKSKVKYRWGFFALKILGFILLQSLIRGTAGDLFH